MVVITPYMRRTSGAVENSSMMGGKLIIPRHFPCCALFVFSIGLAGSAWGQTFSNVVVFGDSLSDSGNIGRLLNLPRGSSFTTNPDPVVAEVIAQAFDATLVNSLAGGSNYAWGGACMNPDTPCGAAEVPTVTEQIDQYLSARPDSLAEPDALYSVWGGANDIGDSLTHFLTTNPPMAQRLTSQAVLAAATVNVEQLRRLQDAGARHILAFNTLDSSSSPFAAGLPEAVRVTLSGLAGAYNDAFEAGMRAREDGIIPINVYRLAGEVFETPRVYGFTDVTGTACGEPDAPSPVSVLCGPAGSDYTVIDKSDAGRNYLFADRSHPSGAAHGLIGSMVVSTLAAPVQVSLAGEGGVEIAGIHRNAVSAERMRDLILGHSAGSWRGYVTGHVGNHGLGALPRLGKARADVQALTLGANHRAGANLLLGAAFSLGRYENDASGTNLDSITLTGSLHGTLLLDNLYLSGALSGGNTTLDIERFISLGAAKRTEHGSTDARQFGAELNVGWIFDKSKGVHHGPFLGLAWLDQRVDDYRESGNLSTSMNFSDFDRDSLSARGGYHVTGTPDSGRARPYLNVAYEREFENDSISVEAGSNTMPGRFILSGFKPAREWASVGLGFTMNLYGTVNAFAGYFGRFGEKSRRDHKLRLGLSAVF